ncbi:hypothetical protein DSCW_23330 [Desulfosarcina widdelii]|uniref:Uncharacterized protein n=1 Tax=Desulfosarcina widdelii TaxID=947919 RepID=A0A5K7YZT7_9BACT|nr:hypothetical protein [Desulfosarcina widdelii]BBO74916.1 hypothetical protein DSCW_23330 [Desulfosarcina widdelii]
MKLIDYYETRIPIWEAARVQELFELARKEYPDIKSIDDAIIQADGFHLKELPFHLLSLTIVFPKKLLPRTKKKFRLSGRYLPDWIKPHVLAFDAKGWMKKGVPFDQLKEYHRTLVEAITTFRIWTRALNYRLRKEIYGHYIIDLVIEKDPKAREELFALLQVGLIAKNNRVDEDLIESEADMSIALSIKKSREGAPPLESFIEDIGLPDHDQIKIGKILQGKNTQEAKLFSDAIAGVFRCLPGEFENDLKNYKEKCRTEKHKFNDGTLSIDELVENRPQIVPKDSSTGMQLDIKLTFDRLSKEFEKPQYIKIKPIFDAMRRDPEISDSDLAKICGIHRNTVPKRKKELKSIYRKLTS